MRQHARLRTLSLLAAIAALAGIFGSTATAPAAACTVDAKLVNSCRAWFGATVGGYPQTGSSFASQFAYGELRLNNPNVLLDPADPTAVVNRYEIIHRYHSPTQTSFDAGEVGYHKRGGTYLFINWKPDLVWARAGGDDATVDARIDAMATSIKALGAKKLFLAIFHEPENDVSRGNCTTNAGGAASGSPSDYVRMWRNVRARFDAKGVTNVVWTMNYMGYSGWNCLVPLLWPGNGYVDWIAYDPYGSGTRSGSLFNDSVAGFYRYLSENSSAKHAYLSKPWGLAEHGAGSKNGTTQAGAIDYWNQAAAAVRNGTFPRLKMYLAFDTSVNGSSQVGIDFSGQPSVDEQTAYNNFANTVRFSTIPRSRL